MKPCLSMIAGLESASPCDPSTRREAAREWHGTQGQEEYGGSDGVQRHRTTIEPSTRQLGLPA